MVKQEISFAFWLPIEESSRAYILPAALLASLFQENPMIIMSGCALVEQIKLFVCGVQ
jgi:hypothetical protein